MTKEERELLIATANAVAEMVVWGQNMGCSPSTQYALQQAVEAFKIRWEKREGVRPIKALDRDNFPA